MYSGSEIEQLGYDSRYCGFNHTTTQEEITAIQNKKLEMDVTATTACGGVSSRRGAIVSIL